MKRVQNANSLERGRVFQSLGFIANMARYTQYTRATNIFYSYLPGASQFEMLSGEYLRGVFPKEKRKLTELRFIAISIALLVQGSYLLEFNRISIYDLIS